MAKPVTQVDPSNGQNIKLTWVAPYANSDAISEYALKFLAKDGNYYTTPACSGVGTPPPTTCSVPMTTLRISPFFLDLNTLVKAVTQAKNTNGFGDLSEANTTGGSIQTEPAKMIAPTRGILTSTSKIYVDWLALVGDSTGSSAIDSYHLQWDKGSDEATWYSLVGQTGTY